KFDLITVGRAAVDLNANEIHRPVEQTMTFTKYVDGSPANVSIVTALLGLNVGMVNKISDDQQGNLLEDYMNEEKVNTTHFYRDKEGRKIGMTITEIKSPEDCSILMYRDNVADLYLSPDEIDPEFIKSTNTLLVSGTALSQSPSRE